MGWPRHMRGEAVELDSETSFSRSVPGFHSYNSSDNIRLSGGTVLLLTHVVSPRWVLSSGLAPVVTCDGALL